jgi:hypothetical protein
LPWIVALGQSNAVLIKADCHFSAPSATPAAMFAGPRFVQADAVA